MPSVGAGICGRPIDDDELSGFDALQQLADVDMGVALCAGRLAVDGEAPLVAPQLACFFDGGGPQHQCAVCGVMSAREFRPGQVRSGQNQRTVGLARIVVLEEEDRWVGGHGFGLAAETALARFDRLRAGDVASATSDIRSYRHGQAQDGQPVAHDTTIIIEARLLSHASDLEHHPLRLRRGAGAVRLRVFLYCSG